VEVSYLFECCGDGYKHNRMQFLRTTYYCTLRTVSEQEEKPHSNSLYKGNHMRISLETSAKEQGKYASHPDKDVKKCHVIMGNKPEN
jgi:hypothetical protein